MPASKKKSANYNTQRVTEWAKEAQNTLRERQQLIQAQKEDAIEKAKRNELARQQLNQTIAAKRQNLTGVAHHKRQYLAHKIAAYQQFMHRAISHDTHGYAVPMHQEILRSVRNDLYTLKNQAVKLFCSDIIDKEPLESNCQEIKAMLSVIKYLLDLFKKIGTTYSSGLQDEFERDITMTENLISGIVDKHHLNLKHALKYDPMNYSIITLNVDWDVEHGVSPKPDYPQQSPAMLFQDKYPDGRTLEPFKRTYTTKRDMTPSSTIGAAIHVSQSRDVLFKAKNPERIPTNPTSNIFFTNEFSVF